MQRKSANGIAAIRHRPQAAFDEWFGDVAFRRTGPDQRWQLRCRCFSRSRHLPCRPNSQSAK